MSAVLKAILYRRAKKRNLTRTDALKQIALGQTLGGGSAALTATASKVMIDRRARRLRPVVAAPAPPAVEKVPDREVKDRLDKVELRMGETGSQLDAYTDRLDKVEARSDKVEARSDKAGSRLDKCEERCDSADKRLDFLEANDALIRDYLVDIAPENQKKAISRKLGKLGAAGAKRK